MSTANQNQNVAIAILATNNSPLIVNYSVLPGGLPATYGNGIALWKNMLPGNWDQPPFAVQPVPSNFVSGTMAFPGVIVDAQDSYLVGYAAGPEASSPQVWRNVATAGENPAASGPEPRNSTYYFSSMQVIEVTADVVVVRYNFPPGITPNTNGAWAGIWQGMQNPYQVQPRAAIAISSDNNEGSFAMQTTILRGAVYMLVLLTSGWKAGANGSNVLTAIACTTTFAT